MHLSRSFLLIALSLFVFQSTSSASTIEKTHRPFTKPSKASMLRSAPFPAPAPLAKRTPGPRTYLGGEIGITSSTLYGGKDYAVGARYSDGFTEFTRNVELSAFQPAIAFMIGALADIGLSDDIGLIGKLGYRVNKANGTGTTPQNLTDPEWENDYTATWNYIYLDALLRFQFAPDGLYGLGGFGFSSLSSNRNSGTQTGGGVELTFEGEQVDFYNKSRADLKLGVGTWIPMGDGGAMLTPELILGFPLTELHTSQVIDDYKAMDREVANMLYVTLGVSFKFPIGSDDGGLATSTSSSSGTADQQDGRVTLRGRVLDAKTGEGLDDVNITVVDLNNNSVVAQDETDDGDYEVRVNAPGRYSVTADAPGYLFGTAYYEVDAQGRIVRYSGDIKLAEASGRTRLLVFFDFDKAELQRSSFPELDRAVALMKANPTLEVEIAGYTDDKGSDSYNMDLSQRRANAVRDYIVRQGVPANRITARGYGEVSPIATNATEEGRAENRRVEFVVTSR